MSPDLINSSTAAVFTRLIDLGMCATLLAIAVWWLVSREAKHELQRIEREQLAIKRESEAAGRCKDEIDKLVKRIQELEDRSYKDSQSIQTKCLSVLETNARAFERLIDLEHHRTPSGSHAILKGT